MSQEDKFEYHKHFETISQADLITLRRKDREYGASWKQRGGVGAFMMLARKWDRLQNALEPRGDATKGDLPIANLGDQLGLPIPSYDILLAGILDSREEGILDDIRDLRRYLIAVEAEIKYQQSLISKVQKENSKPDAVVLVDKGKAR